MDRSERGERKERPTSNGLEEEVKETGYKLERCQSNLRHGLLILPYLFFSPQLNF